MDAINQWLNVPELWQSLTATIHARYWSVDTLVQAVLVLAIAGLGYWLGDILRRALTGLVEHRPWIADSRGFVERAIARSGMITIAVLLWLAADLGPRSGLLETHLIRTIASLMTAWLVIHILTTIVENRALAKLVALMAWLMAALAILGLFSATVTLLDSIAMTFGELRISALTVAKAILAFGILFFCTIALSNFLERQINRIEGMTASAQVLMNKLIKILLVIVAFLIAINSIGIDLTTLAVFGGALGIGIGLGLQRIISNLVSGLILLMDKSIKPNDVIAVGQTYGWVASLGARYAVVRTRDGIEHLIPNEELIIQRVENWTHSDMSIRLKIPVGVSYKTDLHRAMRLCEEAARSVDRVIDDPTPRCLLTGFGESSVDLEVRVWISDPPEGRANVVSLILLEIWNRFHEDGIEIPFPQRDLHLHWGGRQRGDQDSHDGLLPAAAGT